MVTTNNKLVKDLIKSNEQTQKMLAELLDVLNEFTSMVKGDDINTKAILEQNYKLSEAMNELLNQIKAGQNIKSKMENFKW